MILYRGSTTPVEREFPGAASITVVAKDYNGLSIPITTAAKVGASDIWRATLTIPEIAPVCTPTSGYYTLVWTHAGGTLEQEFQVVAYDEGVQRPPPAAFGVAGISLSDELYLPFGSTSPTCEILGPDGSVILATSYATITEDNVTTPTLDSPGSVRATAEFTNIQLVPVGEYVAHWRYLVGSRPMHDYRQAFVISTKMAGLLSSFRMFLDQSQVTRWLGHYGFLDVELIDCLHRAADRINGHPPQLTNYTPDSVPYGLNQALRQAALYEMLNRLYLAEGLSSFDFQGGSVTVNVDRAQYIQTTMSELNSWLETNLTNIKQVTLSSRSIGHLHISVSQGGLNNNYRTSQRYYNPSAFQLSKNFGGQWR